MGLRMVMEFEITDLSEDSDVPPIIMVTDAEPSNGMLDACMDVFNMTDVTSELIGSGMDDGMGDDDGN